MQSILNAISRVIRRPASEKDESSRQFLARCENFRLLLAANNRALEIMAEMSELERAGRVPAIAQVRAMTFKVVASVRQMIERLCRMRPGRYDALKESFDRIVGELERALSDQRPRVRGPLVLPLAELTAAHTPETGSKAALLGEAGTRLGLRVPHGFSITASAYRLFMEETGLQDEINRLTQIGGGEDYAALSALEAAIGSAVASWPLPAPLEAEIEAALEALAASGVGPGLAVRSSALDEDSPGASFAGQFLSVLGVEPGDVVEAWRRVVASMFSAQAMTYRLRRGLRDDGLAMAVGCMEMIDAASGGVAYTRDPLGRRPELVVSAVRGLPDAIVDGSGRADTWLVDRETLAVVEARIEEKRWQNALTPEGRVERRNIVDAAPRDPALSENQVREVARAALALEAHFGGPQDVEWAFAREGGPGNDGEGGLVLLQCRPLHVAGAGDAPEADPGAPILSGAGTACLGRASGPVFLVEGEDDLASFPEGAVLLARNAQPRLAALLPRAAALVAENGSVTGHLANVAREYGVPSLVGASGAVELLAGAGVVTVDADTGAVHAGDVVGLAASPRRPEHGSATAVGAALGRVLPFIAPLHLTDPQAENFSPEGCATLHDITRYCHEKAVIEMFREGGSSGGRLGGARQLVGKGALEYWVVDIGGGTAPPDPDSNERYIPVRHILSNAMQALWAGMTAVPWGGPPGVGAGGFMSVMFEATQNPALAPGAANSMADRNYFIVGEHYCNLQARFGFHFCTIEGFAGDDLERNFVFFQFKGGAADMERRSIRALLVAELLERHGFVTEVRDDALFARIEGVSRLAVERALAVVGYLMIHTRQIDAVMTDPGARERYRARFASEIETLLADMPEDRGTLADWRFGG